MTPTKIPTFTSDKLDEICQRHIVGKVYDLDFSRALLDALIEERKKLMKKATRSET